MQLVHFFITRGLSNFIVPAHEYDDNAKDFPFPIKMIQNISHMRAEEHVIGALQNIELFHSLSTIRTFPKRAFAVDQLEDAPNSQGGILFKIFERRMRTPLSLQESARLSIRESIASIQFRIKLAQLPIPSTLKEYVACESLPDVTSAYNVADILGPHL